MTNWTTMHAQSVWVWPAMIWGNWVNNVSLTWFNQVLKRDKHDARKSFHNQFDARENFFQRQNTGKKRRPVTQTSSFGLSAKKGMKPIENENGSLWDPIIVSELLIHTYLSQGIYEHSQSSSKPLGWLKYIKPENTDKVTNPFATSHTVRMFRMVQDWSDSITGSTIDPLRRRGCSQFLKPVQEWCWRR
jgi:hypothetical protein